MPQPTKNAAKRRPAATRRSPVIKAAKAQPAPHTGAEDDVKITALKLPPGKLSPEMDAYFKKCDEKLGFVPNVLKAFAFDDAKLQAFVDYRQELVQNAASLSKLEIEMIATVVSSQNRCFYCITAHGNGGASARRPRARRDDGDELSRREARQASARDARFRREAHAQPWEVEEEDRESLRRAGFNDRDIWDIASVAAFLQHDQPACLGDRHAAEQRLSRAGKIAATGRTR